MDGWMDGWIYLSMQQHVCMYDSMYVELMYLCMYIPENGNVHTVIYPR